MLASKFKKMELEAQQQLAIQGPLGSGKHSSSTAYAHGLDFERVLQLPEFDELSNNHDYVVKPVYIFTVDGGPNENPRYQKTIEVGVHHFLQNDPDALFITTNAPGRSAFNRVERKMAPLSRELSDLIIPHDNFSSHLDDQEKTIDSVLEKHNFEYAGKQLAETWSSVVVDGFPTVAEFIQPEKSELKSKNLMTKPQLWFANHRQRELMAVIISEEREEETVEWIHEDDLDLVGLTIPNEDSDHFSTTFPILTMDQHLAQPWEDEIL
ncbi:Uncharacterized protein APZ42_031557 [Daphnia magna]|uniref:Uncharacterized protein n=1 Tax=Daphnia magna TaxID=35525 RepID=A0A164MRU9_9CRUS|nr:Uncharacterized protein APZ42_031557 [Daphnia magna]